MSPQRLQKEEVSSRKFNQELLPGSENLVIAKLRNAWRLKGTTVGIILQGISLWNELKKLVQQIKKRRLYFLP